MGGSARSRSGSAAPPSPRLSMRLQSQRSIVLVGSTCDRELDRSAQHFHHVHLRLQPHITHSTKSLLSRTQIQTPPSASLTIAAAADT